MDRHCNPRDPPRTHQAGRALTLSYRVTEKQLTMYLDQWADWMREHDNRQAYPSRDSMLSSTGSREFDAMVSEMESSQCKVIDTAIDDLPLNEKASVYHVKLRAVWRFREPIEVIYARARDLLAVDLARRHLPTGSE